MSILYQGDKKLPIWTKACYVTAPSNHRTSDSIKKKKLGFELITNKLSQLIKDMHTQESYRNMYKILLDITQSNINRTY